MASPQIDEVLVADQPAAWTAAGFTVDPDGACRVGAVRIRLVGPDQGAGIVGWSLRDVPAGALTGDLDGLATTISTEAPAAPAVHSNGVVSIDHLVLLTPDLRRTVSSLAGIGVDPRREREGDLGGKPITQVFFRFGDVILEVVGAPDVSGDGPARLWGVTYAVADIDLTAAFFGETTAPVKDAVQPGRRITTLRNREIGVSVRTAFISPHVRA